MRVLIGVFFLLIVSVSFSIAQPTSNYSDRCPIEAVHAALSNEQSAALRANAVIRFGADAEILLYLHFVPGTGTQVIGGNPSASGFRSTLITGVRTLPPVTMTAQQVTDAIGLVEDDFSPFNIRITTDYNEFLAYPPQQKLISIVTTTPGVLGFSSNTAGIAPFAAMGFRQPSNPSFVFASMLGNDSKDVADTISHEVAHTLGLAHQSRYTKLCGFLTEYHPAIGTGPTAFGPLMGDSFGDNISNWWSQNCLHPTFGGPLRDFQLIADQVVLRTDDLPNEITSFHDLGSGTFPLNGIVEQAGDVDVFQAVLPTNSIISARSQNVDMLIEVFDENGTLISSHDDPDSPNINFVATAGLRTFRISAAGNTNIGAQFMTGKYSLSILAPTAASVSISGRVLDAHGRPVRRAVVNLTGPDGVSRSAVTNTFGNYMFKENQAGRDYVVFARAKGISFANSPRIISARDNIADEDFIGK